MHALKLSHWPKLSGYAFACVALALAIFVLPSARTRWSEAPRGAQLEDRRSLTPPKPEPQLLRQLTPNQAIAANDARPIDIGELQPAFAFSFGDKLASPSAYNAAVECLTAAIYYEAGGQPEEGQKAVAQVVLNRVRHPAFPQTVCGVVYQGADRPTGCQFTFACDGSLAKRPSRGAWERARRIAEDALAGHVATSVGTATHYHANWVVPYWAPHLDKIAVVGSHIFYRWRGFWGQRQAFSRHYAGEASDPPSLAYSGNLLAAWPEDSSKPGDLPSVPEPARSIGILTPPNRPLVADMSAPQVAADNVAGRLVVDDSPSRAPDAKRPGLGS